MPTLISNLGSKLKSKQETVSPPTQVQIQGYDGLAIFLPYSAPFWWAPVGSITAGFWLAQAGRWERERSGFLWLFPAVAAPLHTHSSYSQPFSLLSCWWALAMPCPFTPRVGTSFLLCQSPGASPLPFLHLSLPILSEVVCSLTPLHGTICFFSGTLTKTYNNARNWEAMKNTGVFIHLSLVRMQMVPAPWDTVGPSLHLKMHLSYKPTTISLHLTPEKLQDTWMLTGEMKMVIVTVLWSSVAGRISWNHLTQKRSPGRCWVKISCYYSGAGQWEDQLWTSFHGSMAPDLSAQETPPWMQDKPWEKSVDYVPCHSWAGWS